MVKMKNFIFPTLLCFCSLPALAQDTMAGKVSEISDPFATVQVSSEFPPWAKPGRKLVAAGGVAEIVEIKGSSLILKPGPKVARRLKPEAQLIMREASDADIKACGM